MSNLLNFNTYIIQCNYNIHTCFKYIAIETINVTYMINSNIFHHLNKHKHNFKTKYNCIH